MSKKLVSSSKFLSLILRHEPEKIGITLNAQGWIEVNVLLNALAKYGKPLNRAELESVVRDNDKQRFAFISEDGMQIRANQGHSVEVDLQLEPTIPPETLSRHTPAIHHTDSGSGLGKTGAA